MRAIGLLAGLIGATTVPLAAQDPACLANETVAACWHRLAVLEAGGAGTTSSEGSSQSLTRKTAGLTSLGNGFASTINDFLPQLAGALGLTQATTGDGATSFETNLLLPLGAKPQRVRLQAVLRKPTLYQPLADAFPAATRDVRVAALEKQLGDFDDVRLVAAWNLENRAVGRSFHAARQLSSTVFRQQRELVTNSPEYLAVRRLADASLFALTLDSAAYDPLTVNQPQCPFVRREAPQKTPIGCFTKAKQAEIEDTVRNGVKLIQAGEALLATQLVSSGFYQLGALINNQPQFNLEFAADVREHRVGPDGFRFSARYEGGFANLNGFRAHARARCQPMKDEEIPATCLSQYLARPDVRSAIERGDRFFISAAVTRRSDYSATLRSDSITLSRSGTWDFSATAGYGRYVTFNQAGEETGRLDLTFEWIHHYDDPDRQNRVVASGTYSYSVSPSLVFAAGVSYASNPEFLGDVDKKMSASFGLRYRQGRSAPESDGQ